MRPVREIPFGSGINGRPILDDGQWHLARHRDGVWWTWCGQRVPDDHRCPPRGQGMPAAECLLCDLAYRRDTGMDVESPEPPVWAPTVSKPTP